jgi:uncharacterized protein YbjT (DUF2867 family)
MRVAVFGATGVAGRGVLSACLTAPEVEQVVVVVRTLTGVTHPKLRELMWHDFADLSQLESQLTGMDACFYCLGVPSAGMSEEKYRVVTQDYALAAARALQAASPGHAFHFTSGRGTNAGSRMMWARVKGETELALAQLGLARLTCWRPGYIHPQTPREHAGVGDRIMRTLYPMLRGVRSMTIDAEAIGEAMLEAQRTGVVGTLENEQLRDLADAWRARGGVEI